MQKDTFWKKVGDRMKAAEADQQRPLDAAQWTIVRLDGRKFSRFTKGFEKPFDLRLFHAMRATCEDLLGEFHPRLVYTQSDEITLIFPPTEPTRSLLFGNKTFKWVSIMASYVSVRFNFHLCTQLDGELAQRKRGTAHFDARVFSLPNDTEVALNLMWRVSDIKRNSKNNLGYAHFSSKQMHGLSPREVVRKLEEEKNVRWADQAAAFKWGCFFKRVLVEIKVQDRKTQQETTEERMRAAHGSFDLSGTEPSSGLLALLGEKYLTGELATHFQITSN